MPIPVPIALVLGGAVFWPATLGIAIVFVVVGSVLRPRWARVTCFLTAGILAADCLLAFWLPGDR